METGNCQYIGILAIHRSRPDDLPNEARTIHRLVGQVVKAPAPRAKGPEFESHLRRDFSGSSDLEIGTPVATLPGAWCYRVSAGTGRLSVSML